MVLVDRAHALPSEALVRHCDPAGLGFADTREVADLDEMVGQERAVAAVAFGIGIRHEGYNLFVAGSEGTGRYTAIRRFLEREAADAPVPDDWCYVFNFDDPRRPRALRLPAGRGGELRTRMLHLARDLSVTLPAVFEADEYRGRRLALDEEVKQRRDTLVEQLEARAAQRHVALARTPFGLTVAPVRGTEVLDQDAVAALSADEKRSLEEAVHEVEADLQAVLGSVAGLERELRAAMHELNARTVGVAVDRVLDEVRTAFAAVPAVAAFLAAARADLVERADEFVESGQASERKPHVAPGETPPAFHRCEVNVIVDHAGESGAPVVYEDLPTHPNLLGRIEHVAQLGALLTDFTLIKAGALHRANGGYLVVDIRRLLQQPFAWDELKRVLRAGELRIDGVPQAMTWLATVSLEPEPIPLDVKIVLVGERTVFRLLAEVDPDFEALFKVEADFDDWVNRTPESEARYARLLATVGRRDGLLPFDAAAIARVIDRASRLVDDAAQLTTRFGSLVDVMREADHHARGRGAEIVGGPDVAAALDARRRRSARPAEATRDALHRGLLRVETSGCEVGQVNGLSVILGGDGTFGVPVRITARVRLGRGDVVDIEREVELGGPIHSKGVLILAGFLGGRFARRRPLSLGASIVFEQSYGLVEGDSASMAELCALVSAIADLPVRQSIAITGSVDQLGRSQAVGGVTAKIEGFFDVCADRGLSGEQGVIIPAAVAGMLMLRDDVVEAVAAGRFSILSVDSVDEALEILTGLPAGRPDSDGEYERTTINGRVARRLEEFAELMAEASGDGEPEGAWT